MKSLIKQYGGTVLFVALIFMLLAPYFGIRYGRSPEPTTSSTHSTVPDNQRTDGGAGSPPQHERTLQELERLAHQDDDQPPSARPTRVPDTNAGSKSLGEIEALLNK